MATTSSSMEMGLHVGPATNHYHQSSRKGTVMSKQKKEAVPVESRVSEPMPDTPPIQPEPPDTTKSAGGAAPPEAPSKMYTAEEVLDRLSKAYVILSKKDADRFFRILESMGGKVRAKHIAKHENEPLAQMYFVELRPCKILVKQ